MIFIVNLASTDEWEKNQVSKDTETQRSILMNRWTQGFGVFFKCSSN